MQYSLDWLKKEINEKLGEICEINLEDISNMHWKITKVKTAEELAEAGVEDPQEEAKRLKRLEYREFSITKGSFYDINVTYYDTLISDYRTIGGIYKFSDAFQMLDLGLIYPQEIKFNNSEEKQLSSDFKESFLHDAEPDVYKTLEMRCDIDWNPKGGLEKVFSSPNADFTLELALRLVALDVVRGMESDRAGCIKLKYIDGLCEASQSGNFDNIIEKAVLELIGQSCEKTASKIIRCSKNICEAFEACEEDGADLRCKTSGCIISICGYIEYALRKGILTQLLMERKNEVYKRMGGKITDYSGLNWKPNRFGPERVPENIFNLAKCLADSNSVDIRISEDNKPVVTVISPFCEKYNKDLPDALEITAAGTFLAKKFYNALKISENELKPIKLDTDSLSLCSDNEKCKKCGMNGMCPIPIAAYIRYLRETGRSSEICEAEQFRFKHPKDFYRYREDFDFNLPDNWLLDVSDRLFNAAERLQSQNYVSILHKSTTSNDNMCVCFVSAASLHEGHYRTLDEIEEAVDTDNIDYSYGTTTCHIPINWFRLGGDSIYENVEIVASYIDYLKKSGKWTEHLRKRAENRDNIEKRYDEAAEKNPALRNIVSISDRDMHGSFYGIVQGERGVGKMDQIFLISQMLARRGKTNTSSWIKKTMRELANRDPAFTAFEKRTLYVLTNLNEFLYNYKRNNHNIDDGSPESRLISLLSRFQKETYIIIVDEKNCAKDFLALNSGLNCLFMNNIIKVPGLSGEEMFDIFINTLSDDLREDFKAAGETNKKRFLEYIERNRSAMPFHNRDLAEYIATNMNSVGKIFFPPDIVSDKSASEMLSQMIGMPQLKAEINRFKKFAAYSQRARAAGADINSGNMHMIFMGNPGTGKTCVARIIAKLLFEIGLIKENKLVEVERKDLVGKFIGDTAPRTSEKIKEAMGGVLFIDEAYTLTPKSDNDFGHEAIATLIKAMEDYKDSLIIIFAGYEKEMIEFKRANPGIESRIGYTFKFEDYTCSELVEMFDLKVRQIGYTYDGDVLKKVAETIEAFTKKRDFGNGRFVSKLITRTVLNLADRCPNDDDLLVITPDDIPSQEDMLDMSPDYVKPDADHSLDNIIGLKNIKEKLTEFENFLKFKMAARSRHITVPAANMHMLFTGNPGTGKTTIARIIVEKLYNTGIIHTKKLVEVERKDLIGEYVGKTAPKTAEVIERALNGVLFIDEAYTLTSTNENGFEAEAIATLIKAMEDHKEDLIVIFAGYKNEMRKFVDSNPGIASRLGFTFHFEDYSASELREMFVKKLTSNGFTVTEAAAEKAEKLMQYFCNTENFGNGRFVDKVIQMVTLKQAAKMTGAEDPEAVDISVIDAEQIPSEKEMYKLMVNGENMIDPNEITADMRQRTAVHEIGHALVKLIFFPKVKTVRITVNPEGNGALGYVQSEGRLIASNGTREDFIHLIAVDVAGIAAEELEFGMFESGGTSDLSNARYWSEQMIKRFGMSAFGLAGAPNGEKLVDEQNAILNEAFKLAKETLSEHISELKEAAALLTESGSITEEQLKNIVKIPVHSA